MLRSNERGVSNLPGSNSFGRANTPVAQVYTNSVANGMAAAGKLSSSVGSQAHNNMQPYLAVNFCIALARSFPITKLKIHE